MLRTRNLPLTVVNQCIFKDNELDSDPGTRPPTDVCTFYTLLVTLVLYDLFFVTYKITVEPYIHKHLFLLVPTFLFFLPSWPSC
jgi:hypothetical protein